MTSERSERGGLLFARARGMVPARWIHGNSRAVRRCGEAKASRMLLQQRPGQWRAADLERCRYDDHTLGVLHGSSYAMSRDCRVPNPSPNLLPLPWNSWGPARLASQSCASQQHIECVGLSPPSSNLSTRCAPWPCLRAKIIVSKILPGLCVTKQLLRGVTVLPTAC